MLSIVHTAEVQFRHESAIRDREIAIRAAIRAREEAAALERLMALPAPGRVAWARPIGAQLSAAVDCTPAVA